MHILALDVGLSAVQAAVLDAVTATRLGPLARSDFALDHPTPEAAELPPERLWQAVTSAARLATRDTPGIEGIGLSVATPGLVLLDGKDQPLGPIWTHRDRRSRPAARHVWAAVGEEFLASVGSRPLPGGVSAIAFRQQITLDPYLGHRVKSFLHLNGWLGLRLTGERAFDPANASCTGLFGTTTDRQWSQRWCEFFDVDPAWLPSVLDGAATLGTLRAAVATELNVPAGIPVKLGTDQLSGAVLGTGMQPGDLFHRDGDIQTLAVLTDQPRPDVHRLTRLLGVGPAYLHIAHNPVGGTALDWLRQLCFREQGNEEFMRTTLAQARQRSTRVTLDPAYLGGDPLEIEAHRAAFRDLTLTTDRLELLAAVLEAMRRCHQQALRHLGMDAGVRRVLLANRSAEQIRLLLPEYQDVEIVEVKESALRGVARLFHPGG